MKFEEVLPALREGKKVRRKSWREGEYLKIDGEYLERKDCALLERKLFTDFSLTELLANDWEICEEPLLTEEEKKFIKNILSYVNDETITRIYFDYQPEIKKTLVYFETEGHVIKCSYWILRPSDFQKVEFFKYYTLKELGLDD